MLRDVRLAVREQGFELGSVLAVSNHPRGQRKHKRLLPPPQLRTVTGFELGRLDLGTLRDQPAWDCEDKSGKGWEAA